MADMTPSELDALARAIAASADRRRQDIREVRESLAEARQAAADARDNAIFGAGFELGLKSALDNYSQPIAQAATDAVLAELHRTGQLRNPGTVHVQRVKRDKKTGQIRSVVESEE